MNFNPLDLLKKTLGNLAGNIPLIGGTIKDLINGVDESVKNMTPQERLAFERMLKEDATENFRLALADSADVRKLAMAELEHPFIKFVRPGILFGLFLIIVFWVVFVPLIEGISSINIPPPNFQSIPDQLWWLFGTAYVGYGSMREYGKNSKLKALNGNT